MAIRTETLSNVKVKEEKIARFDVHQIIQHIILMVSFTLLVLTGLPMKFSSLGISQWWAGIWGGIEFLRSVHNVAAWMMITVSIYHVVYLFYTLVILKRPFPIKMIPGTQDFKLFYQEIRYFLGLTKERPLFDRFNWKEKFDYWAIFWGMPVMVVSGLILMFPVWFSEFLPGWIVPAALVAHSHEAMLALIWIFLVHIFFNHFSPGLFPINTSIFTGKVTKERYQKEHPLEYARLTKSDYVDDTVVQEPAKEED